MKKLLNNKPAALGVLALALIGSMSNLPFAKEVIHSADLLSSRPLYINNCAVSEEVNAVGESECRIVHANKVAANVRIVKVIETKGGKPATETTPEVPGKQIEKFVVTSTLEADFCSDGSCTLERTASNLEEAIRQAKDLSDKLSVDAKKKIAEEKERQEKIKKCEIKEDGEEITNPSKRLKCLADTLKTLSGEEAADYYAENIKEEVQRLLQSPSANDRALGMGLLGEIGKNMKINCESRPGLAGPNNANASAVMNNPYLNQAALNPVMTPMRPITSSNKSPNSRDLIVESACDMWAFGTYQNNVEYLQLAAANDPHNRPALNQAMRNLKAGWGQYFQQRGLALRADPLGLGGMSGEIYNDVIENHAKMMANMKEVSDRHKDLLIDTNTQQQQTGNGQPGQGRMARGGIMPQNPAGNGTAVNPWAGNGANNVPAAGRPVMQPSQPNGRFMGAPRMGSPVGVQSTQQAPPLRR